MKKLITILITCLLIGLAFSQSSWEIIQEPTEPLIYSRDNVFFLDQNQGWIVGTSFDQTLILHTSNGGASWEVQFRDDLLDASLNKVKFLDANIGWIVGKDSADNEIIWKTTNGGADWTDQSPGLVADDLRSLSIVDENNVYVSGDDGIVLKTTDGGDNWTNVSVDSFVNSGSDLDDMYAFNADTAFVMSGGNDALCAYTMDGGQTWSVTTFPFPPVGISNRSYACTGKPDGTAYVASYHGNVFKSVDYGQTWTHQTIIFGALFKYFNAISVYGDNIWVGGSDGKVYHSGDGGAVWDTLFFPSSNTIDYIKAFDANNIAVFASYAQLFTSADGGQTFTPAMDWPNIAFYAMDILPNNTIFVGSINGGELTKSTDFGHTWSYPVRTHPESQDLHSVKFLDDNVGFYTGRDGTIAKTTDGGETWEFKPNSEFYYGSRTTYYFTNFYDNMMGMVGGRSGNIQFTDDGGETWTGIDIGSATLYDATYLNDSTAIISGSSGRIYKSTNADSLEESDWVEVVDLGTMSLYDIYFFDDMNGMICASSGYIFQTTDGGDTWTEVVQLTNANHPENDEPRLYKLQFVNATTGYVCGEDGAIYKSEDGGANWTQMTVPEAIHNGYLYNMFWMNEDLGYAVGQNGTILAYGFQTDLETPENVAQNFRLDQNYPNPFNPVTTIGFNLPTSVKVEVTIYNTLGQKVRTLQKGNMSAGYHTLKWNGKNDFGLPSPSGVYFYQLKTKDFTEVNKMILLQ